jgi:plastocyanin
MVSGLPLLFASLLSLCAAAMGQNAVVEGSLSIKHLGDAKGSGNGNVVVWLTPLDRAADLKSTRTVQYRMLQKNKEFHPHVLAVPVGTVVEFPNEDPFFHNVFSLYKGKKFDLGLYEAGASRKVLFDKLGVSFVFCNIHPDMNAYVLALPTIYFDVSDRSGVVRIKDVPYGKYRMSAWYELAEAPELAALERTVEVDGPTVNLGDIQLADSPRFQPKHLNKHGKHYDPELPPY